MNPVTPDPLAPLKGESQKAFAAFRTYLDLGSERSLSAAARALRKSRTLIHRWSRRFDWSGRVAAHTTALAAAERAATLALTQAKTSLWLNRQEDHREAEWALRSELMAAGRAALARLQDAERPATLSEVVRALDLASRLGRLASGLTAETPAPPSTLDLNLRVELEAAIQKVYGGTIDVTPLPQAQP